VRAAGVPVDFVAVHSVADDGHSSASRWFAVGRSSHADAREAGRQAAADALAAPRAKLLIVFSSDSYDLPELLSGAAAPPVHAVS